ncbi:MAG: GNAT family N-acetyltransferase [Anaerolineae bacterium]|nr:GNAT family N-acetyltransferase [Anaerolineae bacterium]
MSDLIAKPVETQEEYLAGRELAARVFTRGNQEAYQKWMDRALRYTTLPGFAYEWHRIGVVDDRVVGFLSARPYRLRYGRVELRVGGIGAVCVDPDYRERGIASALLQDAIGYMMARGDHFSLLDGIARFYPRFGYQTVWPNSQLVFKAADAAALDAPLTTRPATLADAPQLVALYERSWGQRVTMPRSLENLEWRFRTFPEFSVQVVTDSSGQIVGYSSGTGHGHEAMAETAAASRTLLALAGRAALENGKETLEWYLPTDDRLIYDARRWLDSTLHIHLLPTGQWMGRVIDPEAFREAILPEITAQAGIDLRGLIFDLQPGTVHIGLRGQDATNMQLDYGAFLQVVFGVLPPPMLDLPSDAAQLLQRMFPPRVAMIAPWDWF